MAKTLLAVALCLCVSFPSFAATTPKKQPNWAELPQAQQEVLAPLAPEWDKMESQRKRKWIGVAKRYPSMKPDEQARVQKRMLDWVKLTPAQRNAARERFKKLEKLPPEKRQTLREEWDEYTKLPEDQRKQLRSGAKAPKASAKASQSVTAPSPPVQATR